MAVAESQAIAPPIEDAGVDEGQSQLAELVEVIESQQMIIAQQQNAIADRDEVIENMQSAPAKSVDEDLNGIRHYALAGLTALCILVTAGMYELWFIPEILASQPTQVAEGE